MARYYALCQSARSGVTVADTAVPAAPEDSTGTPILPLPAGVWATQGSDKVWFDVAAPSGTTGSYTFNIYAWNRILAQWVSEGQVTVTAAAVGDFGTRLFGRAKITDWASDYIAVMIKTMATNGGSGVGTTYAVTVAMQDK